MELALLLRQLIDYGVEVVVEWTENVEGIADISVALEALCLVSQHRGLTVQRCKRFHKYFGSPVMLVRECRLRQMPQIKLVKLFAR